MAGHPEGGLSPVWGHDGKELFFRTLASGDMMVVPVEADPTCKYGSPELLFPVPYLTVDVLRNRPWDVAPDARFLTIKVSAPAPQINVVLNWFKELKARVPVP